MSDQADWDKWEGWVPGDPEPGPLPGARRPRLWQRWTERQTVPPPPSASRRRATAPASRRPPSASPPAAPAPVRPHTTPARSTTTPPPPVMAHAREAAARSSARGCLITVMVLVAIAGFVIPIIIGGVGLLMANVTDDRTDIPVDVTVPGAPAEPPRAELAGPAPGLLFTGGLAEMVELRRVLGDDLANARQLVVYPDRLVVEVEPPGTPGVVERWVVNPEQPPQGPQPVDVAAEQALAQRFALAEVDSGRLALSVVTAQAELARRGVPLTPSHLVVQRDPLGELRVWVYAGAADDRSIVQLTPAGDVVDVQLGG